MTAYLFDQITKLIELWIDENKEDLKSRPSPATGWWNKSPTRDSLQSC